MCECSSENLFNYGCICGGFSQEKLRIWFNGKIYFIAQSQDHIKQLAKNELPQMLDYDSNWLNGDGLGWRVLPNEQILTFNFNDGSQYTLTAIDWTKMYTPGFLASL